MKHLHFFFCTILGFTQNQPVLLSDIEGFVQLIRDIYKSDKTFNIAGADKVQPKSDCINGSFVNGARETIFYPFVLHSPPGHKICKEPRQKKFKKKNKPVLSHITIHLEDDYQ